MTCIAQIAHFAPSSLYQSWFWKLEQALAQIGTSLFDTPSVPIANWHKPTQSEQEKPLSLLAHIAFCANSYINMLGGIVRIKIPLFYKIKVRNVCASACARVIGIYYIIIYYIARRTLRIVRQARRLFRAETRKASTSSASASVRAAALTDAPNYEHGGVIDIRQPDPAEVLSAARPCAHRARLGGFIAL